LCRIGTDRLAPRLQIRAVPDLAGERSREAYCMNSVSVTGRTKLGITERTMTFIKLLGFSALVLACMAACAYAQAPRTDTVTSSCVFAYGTANCVRQYRYNDAGNSGIKQYGEPAEQTAEARDRERAWEARCRPALRQDAYGVSRYVYAAPGCEYGRTH
jgi:hypothetical protein